MERTSRGEDEVVAKVKSARSRTETLIIKLTAEEKKMAQEIAKEQGGKTVSEWVRERIWNAKRREAAEIYSLEVAQEYIHRVIADLEKEVKRTIDDYLKEKEPKRKRRKGKEG